MEHPIINAFLNKYQASDILYFLITFNCKAFLLLIASFLLLKLIKGSAANRHLLMTTSMLAIFLLPVTSNLIPVIHIPIKVADASLVSLPESISVISTINQEPSVDDTISLTEIVVVGYFLVTIFMLLKIIWGNLAFYILKNISTPVSESRWNSIGKHYRKQRKIHRTIQIRYTHMINSPLTWGFLSPVVLIPRSALNWPEHLIKSTLLHEIAHIHRFDWLITQFSRGVCAFYWINPLCWKALSRLSANAEAACDDIAINSGLKSSHYAEDLIRVAKQIKRRKKLSTPALAMSASEESADLGYRIRAILDPLISHTPNTLLRSMVIYMFVMCLFFPLSSFKTRYVSSLPEISNEKSMKLLGFMDGSLSNVSISSSFSKALDDKFPITENITAVDSFPYIPKTTLNAIPIAVDSQKAINHQTSTALQTLTDNQKNLASSRYQSGSDTEKNNTANTNSEIYQSNNEKDDEKTSSTAFSSLASTSSSSEKNHKIRESNVISKNNVLDKKKNKIDSLGKINVLKNTSLNGRDKNTLTTLTTDANTVKKQKLDNKKLDNKKFDYVTSNDNTIKNRLSDEYDPTSHSETISTMRHSDQMIETLDNEIEHTIQTTPTTKMHVEPYSKERVVKPNYPRHAVRRGIEGAVTVQFDIDSSGNVLHPKVIQAKPPRVFNLSVLKAVKRYLFNPQKVNGEAVEVKNVKEIFTFVIQS